MHIPYILTVLSSHPTHPNQTDIVFLDREIKLRKQSISWETGDKTQSLKLQPNVTYVLPSGYRVEMVKPVNGRRWRLVGTQAEGTLCHKPCTVSGGGKSEISKPISDAIITGPIITSDFKADFDRVESIVNKNFSGRYKNPKLPTKKFYKL